MATNRIVKSFFIYFGIIIIINWTACETIKVAFTTALCVGSGISTIITSAQSVSVSNYAASAQTSVASEAVCAITTHNLRALKYQFKDGVCTVFGRGEGVAIKKIIFGPPGLPPLDSLEEAARNKVTYASLLKYSFKKELAVDGIINNDDSMYHSEDGILHPWWLVDLGEIRIIHQLQIFPRQACCHERFHDIEIRVGETLRTDGNFSSYELMSFYKGPYDLDQGHVICSRFHGIPGRYVSIQRATDELEDVLQIYDVNVFVLKSP